jgi:urea transport system permease protein
MKDLIALLNGPQTYGSGRGFWSAALAVLVAAMFYPLIADSYTVGNLAYFGVWIFMALGLSLTWGYGGMLSFGQTAFFGLAGYTYGVIGINLGQNYGLPFVALFCALLMAMAVALLLGYRLLPDPGRAPPSGGRHHERRPAAAARDRPGTRRKP